MKAHYLFTLTSLAAALLGLQQSAFADDTTDMTLSPVVVTATRTPVTADDTLASVTVINHDQIAESGARDVGDLLNYYAGVNVAREGGIGQQPTSIFLRGANSDQTLVLLDGVRMNDRTSGEADIQNISLATIDHIEIVKGPDSTLYGADAIGGVINIITRKASDTSTTLDLGAGTEHTQSADLRQNFSTDALSGSVNVGGIRTDGYPVFADSTVDNAYKNNNAGVNLNYQKNDLTLRGNFQSNTGNVQYYDDGTGASPAQRFSNTLGTVSATYKVSDYYQTTLRFSSFHDFNRQEQPEAVTEGACVYPGQLYCSNIPTANDSANNTRREVDWQNDYVLPANNLVTLGGTWSEEKVDELSYGNTYDEAMSNTAAYLQDQFQHGAFSAQAGGRVQHDSVYGQHESGDLSLGWAFDKANRVYATLDTAFHAPTSDELYGPDANPELKPEQSLNRELGYRHDDGFLSVQAAVYNNDVKDLIETVVVDPVNSISRDVNVDVAHLRGGELSLGLHQGGWSWQNQASYTRAINAVTEQELTRRPREQLSSNLDYHTGRYNAGGTVVARGQSYDFSQYVIPGSAVLNLHAGMTVNRNLSLKLNLDNVANTHYALVSDYNVADNYAQESVVAQPRLVSVSARLTF